jgi:hypothetical protein
MATGLVEKCAKEYLNWIDIVRRSEERHGSVWDHASSAPPPAPLKDVCREWSYTVRSLYDSRERMVRAFKWHHGQRAQNLDIAASSSRIETEQPRAEFEMLAGQWRRETRHLSIVQKKIIHPAYLRITGMGKSVVPLLLEALRDQPAHWFAALRATANFDPSPPDANPATARVAWLQWGKANGLID